MSLFVAVTPDQPRNPAAEYVLTGQQADDYKSLAVEIVKKSRMDQDIIMLEQAHDPGFIRNHIENIDDRIPAAFALQNAAVTG